MASNSAPRIRSYRTSGVVPAYSFVKFDSGSADKDPTVVVCESGRSLGIGQNSASAASGDTIEVALPGGGAKLKLGGTVPLMQSIKPTTAGVGIVTASDADYIGAMAVEKGVSGDIIGVEVVHGQKASADAL